MVVYLDLIFVLNSLTDALALYITARLSGLVLRKKRLMIASLLGGMYAVLCYLPLFASLGSLFAQIIVAIFLVRLVFGKKKTFLRLFCLFFLLSCTLGGAMTVFSQPISENRILNTLQHMDWKVFFLVGGMCYILLSIVFRADARHAIEGHLCRVAVTLSGRKVRFDALYDTGNTLCDPYNGTPILTVWHSVLDSLWTREEQEILDQLEEKGSIWCAEQLGKITPGRFRLVPYRAIGVACATLLTFQADEVCIDNEQYSGLTIALSPTPVSDGSGYNALWGGERMCKTEDVASDQIISAPNLIEFGIEPPR